MRRVLEPTVLEIETGAAEGAGAGDGAVRAATSLR